MVIVMLGFIFCMLVFNVVCWLFLLLSVVLGFGFVFGFMDLVFFNLYVDVVVFLWW